MNNYYHKYLKYKYKYLNLLEKVKRARENDDDNNVDVDEISTNIKKFKISNYKNFSRAGILAGLFNMYVSEPVYELNPNYLINNKLNADNNTNDINKSNPSHNYNLRGVEFRLRRETDEAYIGSYTPEIIRNLQSNGVSSEVIDELVENFNQDDKANIELLNSQNPLYINFDNNGKNIECWVADNMCCPCCGVKSLRRYVRNNMPCIDLVCSNLEHKFADGVKFFQVKSKSSSITYEPYKNFNFETKQIHTGSKAIGQYSHSIETSGDYYTLLMGYICIEYRKIVKEPNEIIEILPSSFIVLPKIYISVSKVLFDSKPAKKFNGKLGLKKEQIIDNGKNPLLYYWYIDTNPATNIIEFSSINNDVIFFTTYNKIQLFGSKLRMNFITTDYNPDLQEKWKIVPNTFNK
jgi:hypothetical protein